MPSRAAAHGGRVIPFPRDLGLSAPQHLRLFLLILARLDRGECEAGRLHAPEGPLLADHADGRVVFAPCTRRLLEKRFLLRLLEETHLVERYAERRRVPGHRKVRQRGCQ